MNAENYKSITDFQKQYGITAQGHGGYIVPPSFFRHNIAFITFCNEFHCNSDLSYYRKGIKNHFYMLRVFSGSMKITSDGQAFTAKAGSIALINADKPYGYKALEETHFQLLLLHGTAAEIYFSFFSENYGNLFFDIEHTDPIFHDILDEFSSDFPNCHKISLMTLTLFAGLLTKEDPPCTEVIQKAQKYMQEHYNEEVKVDDVASFVHISKYHFSRIFRAGTGFSPQGYLHSLRLQTACNLLSQTNLPVEDIGLRCGFSSISHFIRTFKKIFGITPLKFHHYYSVYPTYKSSSNKE